VVRVISANLNGIRAAGRKEFFTWLASLLHGAVAVVSVDTGLCHLSVALNTPTLSLFGPTNPALVAIHSNNNKTLTAKFDCAPCMKKQCQLPTKQEYDSYPPCFTSLQPDLVWSNLQKLIS